MHIDLNVPTGIGGLLIALFLAWVTANMARSRGREPLIWGLLGFFFPCIAIIALLVVGSAVRKR